MSETVQNWPALSFLEGLRPGPDEKVELALLASYSADIESIGATLLALAGKDNDAGRGGPSDFAEAIEQLRGKARIVIQCGRLAKMKRTPRIAAVLDQFVREVDFDEATHSWHPKAALVRTRNPDGKPNWRLWIGSRNLTTNQNREIGLLLVSDERDGMRISGAMRLARALAERAALVGVSPERLADDVAAVAWRAPAGMQVERLRWSDGSGKMDVPTPPAGTEKVVVVSPFIDKDFLAEQMPEGPELKHRVLLTTLREIDRIGPSIAKFGKLLVLDAPEYPIADPVHEPEIADAAAARDTILDEEEEIGRGLHAKLLFMRTGKTHRLWIGSANATMRAWTGHNVEVTAELIVTKEIENGLTALLQSATCVAAPKAKYEPEAAALEEEALERARAQVAARWAARLVFDDNGAHLAHFSQSHPGGPHPDKPDILLEVGSLNGASIEWPRGQTNLSLGPVPKAERSEFLRLRVSRGDYGCSWLQRAPADPPLGEDRDRAAFVGFLGARGFLVWVAGMLANDGSETSGDWTSDELRHEINPQASTERDHALPTLEEMLAAWARAPEKFREIEFRVSRYLPAVLEQAARESPESSATLREFEGLWTKLCIGLGVHDQMATPT